MRAQEKNLDHLGYGYDFSDATWNAGSVKKKMKARLQPSCLKRYNGKIIKEQ